MKKIYCTFLFHVILIVVGLFSLPGLTYAQSVQGRALIVDTRAVELRTEALIGNDFRVLVTSYMVRLDSETGGRPQFSLGFSYDNVRLLKGYYDGEEVTGTIPNLGTIPSIQRGITVSMPPFSIDKRSIRFGIEVTYSYRGRRFTTTTGLNANNRLGLGSDVIESNLISLAAFGEDVYNPDFYRNFQIHSIVLISSDWDHWQEFGRLKREATREQASAREINDVLRQYCRGVSNNEKSIREAMQAVGQARRLVRTEDDRRRLDECSERLSQQLSAVFQREGAEYERNQRNQNPYYYAIQDAQTAERNGNLMLALQHYRRAYGIQPTPQIANKIRSLEASVQTQAAATGAAAVIGGITSDLRRNTNWIMDGAFIIQFPFTGNDYSSSFGLGSDATNQGMAGIPPYLSIERIFWLNAASTNGLNLGMNAHFLKAGLDPKIELSQGAFRVNGSEVNAHMNVHLFGLLEIGPMFKLMKLEGTYELSNSDRAVRYGGDWQPSVGLRSAVYLKRQSEFMVRAVGWYINNGPDGFGVLTGTDRHLLSYGYRLELLWQPWSIGFYSSSDSYYNNIDNLHLGLNQWGIALGFGIGF